MFPGRLCQCGVFPAGRGQCGVFPAGRGQCGVFPAGRVQCGVFPAGRGQCGVFPAGRGQCGVFPAGRGQCGVFPAAWEGPVWCVSRSSVPVCWEVVWCVLCLFVVVFLHPVIKRRGGSHLCQMVEGSVVCRLLYWGHLC